MTPLKQPTKPAPLTDAERVRAVAERRMLAEAKAAHEALAEWGKAVSRVESGLLDAMAIITPMAEWFDWAQRTGALPMPPKD